MYLKKLVLFIGIPLLTFAQTSPINWQKHIIADTLVGVKKVAIANMDQDAGRARDLVVTLNPETDRAEDPTKPNVIWFQNDGNQNFTDYVIDYQLTSARGIAVGDLTGDGYPDVAVGTRSDSIPLIWYKNSGNPQNNHWIRTEIGGPAPDNYEVRILDFDRDGRLDIVDGFGDDADYGSANSGTVTDSVRFFKNLGLADTAVFKNKLVVQISSPAAFGIADFNNDSLLDVAPVSWLNYYASTAQQGEDLTWWAQQTDTSFALQQQLVDYYGGNDVQAVDLNGDHAIDLVAVGYKTQTLDWWANDGSGYFGSRITIDQNLNHPRHLSVADLDGDGDLDIALSVDNDNTIYWYENDGSENFTRYVVDNAFTYAYFVVANDLDGDGDFDLVGTAQDAGTLAWWENDLAETQDVAAGDPDTVNFNQGKLRIKYQIPYPGGMTSSFFNHGFTQDSLSMDAGLKKIASRGFYTIVSHAVEYNASIIVKYDSISEWQNLATDETTLRFCFWNDTAGAAGKWEILQAANQVVDTSKKEIVISNVSSALHKYSLFTLGVSSGASAIEPQPVIAAQPVKNFNLSNYPNPFNGETWIRFTIPNQMRSAAVRLELFNMLGQKVRTLFAGNLNAGQYRLKWNGTNRFGQTVGSGWYFYRLKVNNRAVSGKLLMVK